MLDTLSRSPSTGRADRVAGREQAAARVHRYVAAEGDTGPKIGIDSLFRPIFYPQTGRLSEVARVSRCQDQTAR